MSTIQGCLVLVGKDIELDAVGRQSDPYLTAGCVCILVLPLWRDLECCSRTVVVINAAANPCVFAHALSLGLHGPGRLRLP